MNHEAFAGDSEFERKLKSLRPNSAALDSEETFYRAGWEAAMLQQETEPSATWKSARIPRAVSFSGGLFAGIAASALLWLGLSRPDPTVPMSPNPQPSLVAQAKPELPKTPEQNPFMEKASAFEPRVLIARQSSSFYLDEKRIGTRAFSTSSGPNVMSREELLRELKESFDIH